MIKTGRMHEYTGMNESPVEYNTDHVVSITYNSNPTVYPEQVATVFFVNGGNTELLCEIVDGVYRIKDYYETE